MKIIESIYLTVPETRTVKRSWKEKLFSWPWKPWVKEKAVTEQVPSNKFFWAGDRIYCHPAIARQLREYI